MWDMTDARRRASRCAGVPPPPAANRSLTMKVHHWLGGGAAHAGIAGDRVMAISAMSNLQASSQQGLQALSQHKHGGHHGHSLSDVDATSSSVASAPSKTGKIGSKIDISA